MGFDKLPKDLKNIICGFAYNCKWFVVEKDLEMCEVLKNMDLSSVFVRREMWSKAYRQHILNPLLVFHPITMFDGFWGDLIDWHAVEELLFRLDFRRKFVRGFATRDEWRVKFIDNWESIRQFDGFYRFLLCTRVPCFKPIWKDVGFNMLSTHHSPHMSARWFLGL